MDKLLNTTSACIDLAKRIVAEADSSKEVKQALCVTLATEANLSTDTIAVLLCISRSTVSNNRRMMKALAGDAYTTPESALIGKTGSFLTEAEESSLLKRFIDDCRKGKTPSVSALHALYAQKVGRPIHLATTYRLLHKHGWRKICFHACHLLKDPVLRKVSKNHPNGIWVPPSAIR